MYLEPCVSNKACLHIHGNAAHMKQKANNAILLYIKSFALRRATALYPVTVTCYKQVGCKYSTTESYSFTVSFMLEKSML